MFGDAFFDATWTSPSPYISRYLPFIFAQKNLYLRELNALDGIIGDPHHAKLSRLGDLLSNIGVTSMLAGQVPDIPHSYNIGHDPGGKVNEFEQHYWYRFTYNTDWQTLYNMKRYAFDDTAVEFVIRSSLQFQHWYWDDMGRLIQYHGIPRQMAVWNDGRQIGNLLNGIVISFRLSPYLKGGIGFSFEAERNIRRARMLIRENQIKLFAAAQAYFESVGLDAMRNELYPGVSLSPHEANTLLLLKEAGFDVRRAVEIDHRLMGKRKKTAIKQSTLYRHMNEIRSKLRVRGRDNSAALTIALGFGFISTVVLPNITFSAAYVDRIQAENNKEVGAWLADEATKLSKKMFTA